MPKTSAAKKRNYEQAFGRDDKYAINSLPAAPAKKRLLESKQVKECEQVVVVYTDALDRIKSTEG